MPFNPSAIVKNRKKWFTFKSRTGSPTASHFNDEGIPTTSADVSIEEPAFAPSGEVQSEETTIDIFSLPPELLVEIFLCSLPNLNWRATVFDRRYAPVNLTQTCHLWREVAIRAPQLWNLLRPRHDTPLDMVQLWISRVRHHPLVVDLQFLYGKSNDLIEQSQVEKLLAATFNPSSSLVEFSWIETICHPIFLSLTPSNFPRLQRVSWLCSDTAARDPLTIQSFEYFWSIAGSVPFLQSATLSRIPPLAPWKQLSELNLRDSPIHPSLRALVQCTQLKKLDWCVHRTIAIIQFTPIVIPNLEYLSISFSDSHDSGLILDCFTVPNIYHIMMRRGCYPVILKSLTRLLHRSNAQLQSFELYAVVRDEQPSLLPFFRDPCLSSLQRFVMRKGQMLEVVWSAFSQASFLPSLEQLQLSVDRDLDIEVVGSYLREREIQGGKLARVIFFVACYCDVESEEVWKRDIIYDGCIKLHPPWDTLGEKWDLCTSTEAIPCGKEPFLYNGAIV